jgi:hypothetical protein
VLGANSDSGGRWAHTALSPRPPNRSNTTVARADGYTYAAEVVAVMYCCSRAGLWRPVPNPNRPIRNYLTRHCILTEPQHGTSCSPRARCGCTV